ncbi:solute:Na+ symporter, SSS family [Cyclonatronum proteinivorum]|uniref:Solute:Na+ symporter, SSS family n=1 Tax=Cyclonatronum proteinivorum TaxID=1457365 RepID=A0A345UN35_9BACT|nr:sodium:solute symporter [Cyclonatronum proteinivorum]AXJ01887.1 solute:Na+ symporter, SSS family [Cyclonatronum proteinivorum]
MTEIALSNLDKAIIVGYFVIIVLIGFFVSRKTETGDDLFLAGRSLGWLAIGFSLFASNISSTTLIGLSGQAYMTGISVANYEWMAAVVLVVMAVFFIPYYIKSRITTIPEFLERRFDVRSRKYFSVITIFLSIVVDTAGGLYAGAIVVNVFFPDIPIWQTILALGVFAGLYTAAGGLKAVVYTDVLQAVILLFGASVLTYLMFSKFDFSWASVTATVEPEKLSKIRPLDDPALPWLGTLIGVPVLGFYYWATNQYIVQRVLGAKDIKNARWGAMLGGTLKLTALFIMVLPGVMAFSVFPNLDDPDMVFPTMVANVLPIGITGLVLAGLISAILSSIDSTLNSASTLITMDFVKAKNPNITNEQTARIGRITTLVLMVVAVLWAPNIANFEGIFAYIQQAFSYIVPPVVAIFFMGILWERGSRNAAFITLVVGHGLSLVLFILSAMGVFQLHFTITAGLLTIISFGVFYVVSIRSEAPETGEFADITWKPADARPSEPMPLWQDYRVHSVIVLLLTAASIIAFW